MRVYLYLTLFLWTKEKERDISYKNDNEIAENESSGK